MTNAKHLGSLYFGEPRCLFQWERHIGGNDRNSECGKLGEKREGNTNQKRPNKVKIEKFTEAKCYIHSEATPYIPPYTHTHTP